jgi:hypothetical protein
MNVSGSFCSDGGSNSVLLGSTYVQVCTLGVQADHHIVIIVLNSKHLKQLQFLNVVPLHMLTCILIWTCTVLCCKNALLSRMCGND